MSNRPRLRIFNTPAERRARLHAEEPGEMVFHSQIEYVEAMQARVRRSPAKQKDLAREGQMSGSTVGNMKSGKTVWPRFSTMFGIAAALGLVVTIKPGTTEPNDKE